MIFTTNKENGEVGKRTLRWHPCFKCGGTKEYDGHECGYCNGTGGDWIDDDEDKAPNPPKTKPQAK